MGTRLQELRSVVQEANDALGFEGFTIKRGAVVLIDGITLEHIAQAVALRNKV